MSPQYKDSRIDVRVKPDQKEVLERAASIKGVSLSAYLLSNSLETARTEIERHQKLVLSDRDRDLFITLMSEPPEPSQALTEAMAQYQQEYEE